MWDVVFQGFVWCQETSVGAAIRDSLWLFPVIETFHLLALSVMGGMVLAVDLRLLGFGFTKQPFAVLAREVEPWLVAAVAVMLASGFLLFASEALKCWENGAFWMKMECLVAALLFTFTVRRRYTQRAEPDPRLSRVVALVSIGLWTGVGIGGRAIGFY